MNGERLAHTPLLGRHRVRFGTFRYLYVLVDGQGTLTLRGFIYR